MLQPFGRYFASRADLLTREGFKTIVPIDGVSPFSGVGEPDPEMQRYAEAERVTERAQTEIRKDLATRLAQSDAEFLVVDNSTALLTHREVNGRLYTVVPAEETDLMAALSKVDGASAQAVDIKLSSQGFADELRSIYDSFVEACLASFDPAKIILVRSHSPRFWIAEDGAIAVTDVNRSDARFLGELDDYFARQTGCLVALGALGHFPSAVQWQAFDHRLRRVIEKDLVELCNPQPRGDALASTNGISAHTVPAEGVPAEGVPADGVAADGVAADGVAAVRVPAHPLPQDLSAADHVVGAFRESRPVDWPWLENYFTAGGATYDDLVALAFLEQRESGAVGESLRACVRSAVADPHSRPLALTKRVFDRSLGALRGWRWCSLKLPRKDLWTPQITVPCSSATLRFLGDGSIQRVPASGVAVPEAAAVVEGRLRITPLNVHHVLGSWAVYLERGRRRITSALRVVVSDVDELVDSCSWLDWADVLDHERVVITTPDVEAVPARGPKAKTDLSFIFDSNVRVCTVGGGLMDQITHIALFDDLCTPQGLDYYLDDFRYIWWRSHNGFEASRLAPSLEPKRLTRLVSSALIESFRDEVMKTRLPWVFNQSRVWYEFGLREATVVTRDYSNARRLLEIGPPFPVLMYLTGDELGELIREPPSAVCFYTTQHRIAIVADSAAAIRRVFSFSHLEAEGLDPEVARTAELLRSSPHVAVHVRRGDYMHPHFDTGGWHAQQSHYVEAIDYLINHEYRTSDFDVAVFSDDIEFVAASLSEYGLDRVTGTVRFMRGNSHYKSIFDSYLMSLCPIIVGSVGSFAATTSLLADPPSTFIRARPESTEVVWRRSDAAEL